MLGKIDVGSKTCKVDSLCSSTGHFRVATVNEPHIYGSEAKGKTFHIKISFVCI